MLETLTNSILAKKEEKPLAVTVGYSDVEILESVIISEKPLIIFTSVWLIKRTEETFLQLAW